jgi:rubrerythrin
MNTSSLLDAIRVVKENERFASASYWDAARKIENPSGRFVFEELSKFEEYHYNRLTALEKALEADGTFIEYEGREFPLPPALEVPAVKEPAQKDVLTIITQAIELEENAKKAYADLAGQIDDPRGKKMFERLANEEYRHYQLLIEAYWSVSYLGDWRWMM